MKMNNKGIAIAGVTVGIVLMTVAPLLVGIVTGQKPTKKAVVEAYGGAFVNGEFVPNK